MCSPEIPNMDGAYRLRKTESIPHLPRDYRVRGFWGALGLLGTVVCGGLACEAPPHPNQPKGENLYQLRTGVGVEEDRSRWDEIYSQQKYVYGTEPSEFLRKHLAGVSVGRALDLAMGEGRNAVYLARKGFRVEGVDISEVALRKAKRLARENRVQVKTVQANLNDYRIRSEAYDLIVMIDYFQRSLLVGIEQGLRPGGYVILEAVCISAGTTRDGEGARASLRCEEVGGLFPMLEKIHFSVIPKGDQQVAFFVARRPL